MIKQWCKIFLFAATFFALASVVNAQGYESSVKAPTLAVSIGGQTQLLSGIGPCQDDSSKLCVNWLAEYVSIIYRYGVSVTVILAVVSVMIGGFLWLVSAGSPDKVGRAKEFITAAIFGLVIALFSFLILQTVNPRLVNPAELTLIGIKASVAEELERVNDPKGCCGYYSGNKTGQFALCRDSFRSDCNSTNVTTAIFTSEITCAQLPQCTGLVRNIGACYCTTSYASGGGISLPTTDCYPNYTTAGCQALNKTFFGGSTFCQLKPNESCPSDKLFVNLRQTSTIGGTHTAGSCHYIGMAADFVWNNIQSDSVGQRQFISAATSCGLKVVNEVTNPSAASTWPHMHVAACGCSGSGSNSSMPSFSCTLHYDAKTPINQNRPSSLHPLLEGGIECLLKEISKYQ